MSGTTPNLNELLVGDDYSNLTITREFDAITFDTYSDGEGVSFSVCLNETEALRVADHIYKLCGKPSTITDIVDPKALTDIRLLIDQLEKAVQLQKQLNYEQTRSR